MSKVGIILFVYTKDLYWQTENTSWTTTIPPLINTDVTQWNLKRLNNLKYSFSGFLMLLFKDVHRLSLSWNGLIPYMHVHVFVSMQSLVMSVFAYMVWYCTAAGVWSASSRPGWCMRSTIKEAGSEGATSAGEFSGDRITLFHARLYSPRVSVQFRPMESARHWNVAETGHVYKYLKWGELGNGSWRDTLKRRALWQ